MSDERAIGINRAISDRHALTPRQPNIGPEKGRRGACRGDRAKSHTFPVKTSKVRGMQTAQFPNSPRMRNQVEIAGVKSKMATKLKLMVVDDEPDNLDLLYRTFRRDFQVFKADIPVSALQILEQEGEMAVIISDQSMPEMTGTEFFSKTLDLFPDTMRILLTGYSEDILEESADKTNNAYIFKCITKPFDPQELKAIVQQAVEIYQTNKSKNDEL